MPRRFLGLSLLAWVVALASGCGEDTPSGSPATAGGGGNTAGGAGVASAGKQASAGSTSGGAGSPGAAGSGGSPVAGGNSAFSGAGGVAAGSDSGRGGGGQAGGSTAAGSSGTAAGGGAGMAAGGRGSGGGPPVPVGQAPVYNGYRGANFNADWKFNRGDASGAQAPSFDASAWRTLDVPHDWSIELDFNSGSRAGANGGYLDGGIGWYRKSFSLNAASSGKKILIGFDGVYMNSEVWINGTSLGVRPYGYSTFEYDLTPHLKFDGTSNVIAVKVNNEQPNSRWYSGSGIYRNVWLTELEPVHIPNSGVFVTTPDIGAESATVAVSTTVQNDGSTSASVAVTTTISDASGATIAFSETEAHSLVAGASAPIAQTLIVPSPQLWSVSTPYLYWAKVEVKVDGATVDTYVTSVGIRSVAFNPSSGFSLNGQNMKIQGVNMHHDLGALGAALNYRALERQVQILKAMGVNAIRTSHNPSAPELLEIADRLGIMILEEAFDCWREPKTTNDYALYFDEWAQRDIQDMTRRDRNRPSVIMWSIGNEVGGSTIGIAENLKNWVLAVDNTRAITWGSNKMGGPHVSEGDDRNVSDLLDVQGYNYAGYAGDYDADHSAHPTWNLLGSETSAALRSRGFYRAPAGTVTKATSSSRPERQSSSYDNETTNFGDTAEVSYARDMSRPFVAGSFIWAGFDYIGEPTPYGWPAKSSYYGIVDTAGFPKDVYYFYQSRWTGEPMVHLLPHWNWPSGTSVTIYAYNNCDSVELFLNDSSQGEKSFVGSALHSEWTLPFAAGTLRADCKKNGSIVATDTVKTAGAAAKIGLSADRARIAADGQDLVFITADVQDADGTIVPDAENSISFSVTGPGEIVGVDNGNPIDTSRYKATSRKAFSGKALAIVRATKMPGSVVISATSNGLTSQPVTVEVQ
jgi:beta-galactosidase